MIHQLMVDFEDHVKCARCRICRSKHEIGNPLFDRNGLLYCKKHYDAFFGAICSHCEQSIERGTEISAVSKYFHPDHFFCQGKCGQLITDSESFFVVDNKQYCAEDFEIVVPKCPLCKNKVYDTKAISANGFVYHAECLSCEMCSAKFVFGMNFFQGSELHKFLCLRDFQQHHLKPCGICKSQIISPFDSIIVSGVMYHKKCFTCYMCKKPSSYLDESTRFCRYHYELEILKKCIICDSQVRVDMDFVSISGKGRLHRECAKCEKCKADLGKKIDSIRFSKTQAKTLICDACFASETGQMKCHACEQVITQGSVMTIQKTTFHKACLKCEICLLDLVGQKLMLIRSKPCCIKHLR